MATRLTAMELAGLIERLQYYKNMPPEKRIVFPSDVACQPCDAGNQLFDILREGKPTASEITQFHEHLRQCTSCGKFLRDVWLSTDRDGY